MKSVFGESRNRLRVSMSLLIFFVASLDWIPANPAYAIDPPDYVSPSTGMEFVKIKGGCFQMGSVLKKRFEQPVHEVCVGDFYLGRYEVTQKQWMVLMEENRSKFRGERRPVDMVSWNDAQSFVDKLNSKEQTRAYRLPTEAEWEYAARAGSVTEYPWGDEMNDEYAWYYATANFQTRPVGQARPNSFGLFDMFGNLWEWTADWFGFDYYSNSPRDNPKGPENGKFRVRRGGSWANFRPYVRSATRYRGKPDHRHHTLGMRVAYDIN